MMLVPPLLIAHRGNITGPNPEKENHPEYIDKAIACGYDVEVDVWDVSGKLVLGHDVPQYEIDMNFLFDRKNMVSTVFSSLIMDLTSLLSCVLIALWTAFRNLSNVGITSSGLPTAVELRAIGSGILVAASRIFTIHDWFDIEYSVKYFLKSNPSISLRP